MNIFSITGLTFLFLLALPARAADSNERHVSTQLLNSQGENVGTVMLHETNDGVKIIIDAQDLPPGEHGIHFHEFGKCDQPDFKTAGEHFNATKKMHGLKNPKGPHIGDLPNLTVAANGRVQTEITSKLVTLKPGKNSLLKEGGTALVIHQKADDQKTPPTGNSGERIACGVIQSSKQ